MEITQNHLMLFLIKMPIKEKIKFILRKYPNTKFNRAEFWWAYFEEFFGVRIVMSKKQWMEFYPSFSSTERALRDILKEEEFKLEPKIDQKRYEKASLFKEEYKPK